MEKVIVTMQELDIDDYATFDDIRQKLIDFEQLTATMCNLPLRFRFDVAYYGHDGAKDISMVADRNQTDEEAA